MFKIYLADLVYDTIKSNYVVPLNIAYLAANLKRLYGNELEITLFKYAKELEKALADSPPHMLGFSNYSWNENLNRLFLEIARKHNPDIYTVMGGPNIRTDADGISKFMHSYKGLNSYVMFEGEEIFAEITGKVMGGEKQPVCKGAAFMTDDGFVYESLSFKDKPRKINLPSPYLSGILDNFLKDKTFMPLLESNRGCPFSCVYCAWGISALSKLRVRPLEMVFAEIEYIAEHSAGQVNWVFCDANFGILPRDIEIAEKVRSVMDHKKYPVNIIFWNSKNTYSRNLKITETLDPKRNSALIAIQSADPEVLMNSGRGRIDFEQFRKEINFCKSKGVSTRTDILLGLPGESFKSHLSTLIKAFDMGYDCIHPINIRLLPGSIYETDEFRSKYGVKTKFRPIFGAYGIYDGRKVFEMEESVRATKDISEEELNSFKTLHWLIFFIWDLGFFKPLLLFAGNKGANPGELLFELTRSENKVLSDLFSKMKKASAEEWFESREKMLKFYDNDNNYNEMVNNFAKLNFLYIGLVYQDKGILKALEKEITKLSMKYMDGEEDMKRLHELASLSYKLICDDITRKPFSEKLECSSFSASIIKGNPELACIERLNIEIYRPQEYFDFAAHYLSGKKRKDLSLQDFARFFEIGGIKVVKNEVRVL